MQILLSILMLALTSCNTTTEPLYPPPPVVEPTLTLEIDDAHCTEAWLQLKTKDLELPAELTLKQYNSTGDSVSQIFILNSKDSLLCIDSLLPNQNYSFQVSNIKHQVSSINLPVTTMDTTSHNFTFEMVSFGGAVGSSVLYDVAIINENDIWAVGEIWIADTSSLGYTKYNAVHWDGTSWELKKIRTNSCGGVEYPLIKAILAFSADNILFAHIDGSITYFNGLNFINDCSLIIQLNGSANKIWGLSKEDYYVVSGNGFIAHYNGVSWQRIESNTTLNINDIWGDYNEKTQEWEILAVAGNILQGTESERAVLKIKNNLSSELLNAEGTGWPLSGIWFKSNKKYYLVGSGIYKKTRLNESWWDSSLISISEYHTNAVRANKINDVFIVGAYGEFLHFNGLNWKSYQNELGVFLGSYKAISIKNDIVISVGYESTKAKILVGRR